MPTWCLLLIVFCYLVFARYRLENGETSRPVTLHWLLVLAVILMPAWSYARYNLGFVKYDANRTQSALQNLQDYVKKVDARDGEILFITQRHLISMHMLDGVKLVPEYEREDLMEMAMANNTEYLSRFRSDLENQRFALILVDPLNFNIMSRSRSVAKNEPGTVAMARTNNPHSATSHFFINLVNNTSLNYPSFDGWGYAVFDKVTQGLDVVQAIGKVQTGFAGGHQNVPVKPVIIESAKIVGSN